MSRFKKFVKFVSAQTVGMGLFTWIGIAVESLWERSLTDFFSAAPEIIFWGAAMSLLFIFVGAFICMLLTDLLPPKYFRGSCVVVGFFCLFPFLFTKEVESVFQLIPGILGLILWFYLTNFLRENPQADKPVS